MSIIYLIEWRTKSGWSEEGQGRWEVDHNSGIWFTREGALSVIKDKLNSYLGTIYTLRVAEYIRKIEPVCEWCEDTKTRQLSGVEGPARDYLCEHCHET